MINEIKKINCGFEAVACSSELLNTLSKLSTPFRNMNFHSSMFTMVKKKNKFNDSVKITYPHIDVAIAAGTHKLLFQPLKVNL
jgi:hypothetical protein